MKVADDLADVGETLSVLLISLQSDSDHAGKRTGKSGFRSHFFLAPFLLSRPRSQPTAFSLSALLTTKVDLLSYIFSNFLRYHKSVVNTELSNGVDVVKISSSIATCIL